MKNPDFSELDLNIARARIVLSVVLLLSMYVDPTTGGLFGVDRYSLITMAVYFIYSVAIYYADANPLDARRIAAISTILDISFATALAFFTEGTNSPAFVMFMFAIVAGGSRGGLRQTVFVTACTVAAYWTAIWLAGRVPILPYVMRAVYLAIAGYVIGFFGQRRMEYEAHLRELETTAQRHQIARSLHDGYIQALAGINLRLESCRDILKTEQPMDAFVELTELQTAVAREYDEVRAYVRSLVQADPIVGDGSSAVLRTDFHVTADFTARGLILEQVIHIMLEGMRNTQRHGQARAASIDLRDIGDAIRITIDDDGVGFVKNEAPPWTIASRVAEFGGRLKISSGIASGGAHLEIEMPRV